MGNLGGGEILVILLVALIFLGPQKLPDAARQVGKAMAEFRKVTSGFQQELQSVIHDDGAEAEARQRGDLVAAAHATETAPETAAAETAVPHPTPPAPVRSPSIDPATGRTVVQPGGDL